MSEPKVIFGEDFWDEAFSALSTELHRPVTQPVRIYSVFDGAILVFVYCSAREKNKFLYSCDVHGIVLYN